MEHGSHGMVDIVVTVRQCQMLLQMILYCHYFVLFLRHYALILRNCRVRSSEDGMKLLTISIRKTKSNAQYNVLSGQARIRSWCHASLQASCPLRTRETLESKHTTTPTWKPPAPTTIQHPHRSHCSRLQCPSSCVQIEAKQEVGHPCTTMAPLLMTNLVH